MPKTRWTVPYGADQTLFLVVDRGGWCRGVCLESEVERTDIEIIICELMSGQFNDPVRIVAFNTLEHWSKDISEDIAHEILARCDIEGAAVPEHIRDFVASYTAVPAAWVRRSRGQRHAEGCAG